MSTASTIISWVLAVGPQATTPYDTSVSDIDVASANETTEVLVYDEAGEVFATLVIWIDADGRVRMDADFADGHYLSVAVVDGEEPAIESSDRAQVAERLSTIMDNANALDDLSLDGGTTSASIGGCAWGVISTAGACAAVRPIFCVVGGVIAACNCLPLIVEELEEYSCPYL
jgi:hypothetical protein